MINDARILDVTTTQPIPRHQIANRLTGVERRLMKHFTRTRVLITCVGNIGAGKSSLIKLLAYSTGMNALFELPDEGFEDHIMQNDSVAALLATAKDTAKRTLSRYYGAINEFIACQTKEPVESQPWMIAKRNLERAALDIQHAYLDLRKMQLQALPHIPCSTCVDGSMLADRFAFCEVLHNDMGVPYLTKEALNIIDGRLAMEFKSLAKPDLLIFLHGPEEYLFRNINERERKEEHQDAENKIPEGLARLVRALNQRYNGFTQTLRETGWYDGPVLRIDVSKVDFVSNVRHLIAVYEGIEKLIVGE